MGRTAWTDDSCTLQSIGLGGNNITDQAMEVFCKSLWNNTFLESLGLGGNGIG
jgi:Ran GTPase-activating protein (RanGAP) involved in mRNA processing and transport